MLFIGDRNVKTHEQAVQYLQNGPLKSYAENNYGLSMVEKKDDNEILLNHMLLEQLLGGLEEKERDLILLRYYQDKTQTEVAGMLGISQVQVSRMEKKILRRMREKV